MHGKKICVITSTHNPFDTRIFHKECYSFIASGYSVTLIAPTDTAMQQVNGIEIRGFGRLASRWARVHNLLKIGRMALQCNAAVYHIHEQELLLLLPLIRLLRPGAAFVYDVHENYSDAILSKEKHWIHPKLKPVIAFMSDVVEKFISRFADLVVAASPDIERRFRRHRTITVRNFAPMHLINPIVNSVPMQPVKDVSFIYTGSLTPTRGILEIVRALALFPEEDPVYLKVTGWFHDQEFQKKIEMEKGFSRVRFLGRLDRYEDMLRQSVSSRAALVCFHPDPNLNNAVERSNKLFEYMGMGIPLVISNIPEWAAMVTQHQCGLIVDPMNPADIAEKLAYLVHHPVEAAEMGRHGRAAVVKKFSWDSEGTRLVASYDALTRSTRKAKPAS